MSISLKDMNKTPLAAALAANLALFYTLTQTNSLMHGQWGALLKSWPEALKGTGAFVFIGILNAQVSQEMKARIVFWRWNNPLPGSEAFSKYALSDPRIDVAALQQVCGQFPTSAKQQNSLWYKLYKSVADDASVKQVHREFLFARDYACLSLMAALILGGFGFLLAPLKEASGYLLLLTAQFLFASRAARHYGQRFVTTVLALKGAGK